MKTYVIENDVLRVGVSPRGAELQSIYGTASEIEYLWQGDPRYWAARAPVLFPIVGRVRDGRYRYGDAEYTIRSPHGFAQDRDFKPDRLDPGSLRLVLDADDRTREQYPFDFRLAACYTLGARSLRIRFDVENRGERDMPFSLGFHPGFRVPVRDGVFEEHRLAFEENERPEQWTLDGVFMSGNRVPYKLEQDRFLPLRRSLFDDDAIILDGLRKKTVALLDPAGRPLWTLRFDDFRFLAVWQPAKKDAPFLCPETWNGLPDFVGDGPGLLAQKPAILSLSPGETYTASVRLDFEP